MGDSCSDRCDYVSPYDNLAHCCFRIKQPGSDCCAWHSTQQEKNRDSLFKALTPSEIREKTRSHNELLDGAQLRRLNLNSSVSFEEWVLRGLEASNADLSSANFNHALLRDAEFREAVLTDAMFDDANLQGANLKRANLESASLVDADLRNANLKGTNLSNADLRNANLSGAVLRGADLSGANLSGACLDEASLQHAKLPSADLRDVQMEEATAIDTQLENVSFLNSTLNGTDFRNANLHEAHLRDASLEDVNFKNATLRDTNLRDADMREVSLWHTDLTGAYLRGADLTDGYLRRANLTDADLPNADLTRANLERAILVRTDLFDAELEDIRPYGASFTDTKINKETSFGRNSSRGIWSVIRSSSPRCAYDSADEYTDDEEGVAKAADTYRMFEQLAEENSFPKLQSRMFVRRQDVQKRRSYENGRYFDWVFATVSRALFKYGESLSRIFFWSAVAIISFAGLYSSLGLVTTTTESSFGGIVDALYFSTLTFTTLGFGDFQPITPFGRATVTLQAALGAVLIATFVFVLGRRAAR